MKRKREGDSGPEKVVLYRSIVGAATRSRIYASFLISILHGIDTEENVYRETSVPTGNAVSEVTVPLDKMQRPTLIAEMARKYSNGLDITLILSMKPLLSLSEGESLKYPKGDPMSILGPLEFTKEQHPLARVAGLFLLAMQIDGYTSTEVRAMDDSVEISFPRVQSGADQFSLSRLLFYVSSEANVSFKIAIRPTTLEFTVLRLRYASL